MQELSIFVRTAKLPMRSLETARLLLRPFCQDDWQHLSEWEEGFQKANGAQAFLDFCHGCYQKWGIGPWAVVVKQTGVVAGNCGFVRIHFIGNSGEVSYYICPSHRSHGFASEALKAVLTYGFSDLDLYRIQARCALDNSASERVIQRAQMKFERIVVSDSDFDDRTMQNKLYAMMRDEFNRLPSLFRM